MEHKRERVGGKNEEKVVKNGEERRVNRRLLTGPGKNDNRMEPALPLTPSPPGEPPVLYGRRVRGRSKFIV